MSGLGQAWIPGFDPASGALGLPLWSAAVVAALFVAFCVFTFNRSGRGGLVQALPRAGLVLLGAVAVWAAVEAIAAGSFASERRALDARLLEMNALAFAPGSALACLDGTAGDLVESSCEKALFASPQAVAAAASYVGAQLSFLADGVDYERRSGAYYELALRGLRSAVEADRFGIVAHLLVDRDGCTPARCNYLALLRDASQVADNMTARTYEAKVMNHAAEWSQSALASATPPGSSPAAAEAASAPTGAASQSPPPAASSAKANGLFFPSSSSIPPVSIMTPEPAGSPPPPQQSQQQQPGAEAQAAAGKPPAAAARKPAPAPAAKRAASPAPTRLTAPDKANDQ